MNGMLLTHRGAIKVPREALYHMQTPARTESWVPVPHGRLIDTIQTVLKSKGLSVKREEYAVMRNDNILFGVMDLTWETEGRNAALGLRTSNNKSFAIQIAIGARVLVCDNLMLSGELIALKRKHTAGLDLVQECSGGIDRYIDGYHKLNQRIFKLENTVISVEYAKAFVFQVFAKRIIPVRLFPEVARYLLPEPNHITLWDLNNHFTAAMKNLPPAVAFEAHTKLGKFFHLDHSPCVAVPVEIPDAEAGIIEARFTKVA